MRGSSSGHNPGYIPPNVKCGIASGSVFTGGDDVAVELELIVDAAVVGEKALRMTC